MRYVMFSLILLAWIVLYTRSLQWPAHYQTHASYGHADKWSISTMLRASVQLLWTCKCIVHNMYMYIYIAKASNQTIGCCINLLTIAVVSNSRWGNWNVSGWWALLPITGIGTAILLKLYKLGFCQLCHVQYAFRKFPKISPTINLESWQCMVV